MFICNLVFYFVIIAAAATLHAGGKTDIPLLVIIMLVSNNRKIMGDKVNGRASNIIGWFAVVVMFGAAVGMLLTLGT